MAKAIYAQVDLVNYKTIGDVCVECTSVFYDSYDLGESVCRSVDSPCNLHQFTAIWHQERMLTNASASAAVTFVMFSGRQCLWVGRTVVCLKYLVVL